MSTVRSATSRPREIWFGFESTIRSSFSYGTPAVAESPAKVLFVFASSNATVQRSARLKRLTRKEKYRSGRSAVNRYTLRAWLGSLAGISCGESEDGSPLATQA